MLFWILAAFLTLAASLAVMRPFLRKTDRTAAGAEHDLAVYRDQLSELEKEVRRGLISEADAADARAEIGRRILHLKQAGTSDASTGASSGGRLVAAIAMAAVLAVPAVSWGLYALLGSPGQPSLPLAARLARDPSQASLEELIARVEAHLSENPGDARGWETLAPIYARLGRYGDAASAYRRAIELAGATADREAGLGEALVGEGGGIVTAAAEAALERALALDPENPRARFFVAMGHAQEGEADEAQAIWTAMATSLPEDSPWRRAVNQALAGLEARKEPAAPGPSDEDLAAADEMTPEARRDMIEGMVAGLDARLRENPDDPQGWRRLVRSYVVLGEREEAEAALVRAREALGSDSADAKELSDFAASFGIGESE